MLFLCLCCCRCTKGQTLTLSISTSYLIFSVLSFTSPLLSLFLSLSVLFQCRSVVLLLYVSFAKLIIPLMVLFKSIARTILHGSLTQSCGSESVRSLYNTYLISPDALMINTDNLLFNTLDLPSKSADYLPRCRQWLM